MLSKQKKEKTIRKVFPSSKIISIKKFKKGLVNETYSIKISNPKKELILRIYPKESWKAEKEAYLYGLIAEKTDVPVPKVYKISKSYLILSKIEGKELPLKNDLIKKAGEYLAKIHSIKMPYFGWIVNKEIKPKFNKWQDFLFYDINYKIKKTKIPNNITSKIRNYAKKNKFLLDIKTKPCLLHKDYHKSHIIIKNNKINGIIDFEWAIAGHNELDIVKSLLWMFEKNKKLEKIFLGGYKKYGIISNKFNKRRRLYELIIYLSALNFAYELKNKKWYSYNLKKIKKIIGR